MAILLLSNTAFANNKGGLEGFEVGTQANVSNLKKVVQKLVAPPFLPEHEQVATGKAKIIQVRMVIEEKEIEIEPGALYGRSPSMAACPARSSSPMSAIISN